MPNPSNEAKQRWNDSHYTQMKFNIKPDIAAAFKDACAAADVSMAGVISGFMAEYSQLSPKCKTPADPFATRRLRRKFIKGLILQMEKLMSAEERCRDNTPDNLQGSKWYEAAENSIDVIHEVIDLLGEIYL
jgi:hypothetical protein